MLCPEENVTIIQRIGVVPCPIYHRSLLKEGRAAHRTLLRQAVIAIFETVSAYDGGLSGGEIPHVQRRLAVSEAGMFFFCPFLSFSVGP